MSKCCPLFDEGANKCVSRIGCLVNKFYESETKPKGYHDVDKYYPDDPVPNDNSFTVGNFVTLLLEWGDLKWVDFIPVKQPEKGGHGSCCNCTTCWYDKDECVCNHNEVWSEVLDLLE